MMLFFCSIDMKARTQHYILKISVRKISMGNFSRAIISVLKFPSTQLSVQNFPRPHFDVVQTLNRIYFIYIRLFPSDISIQSKFMRTTTNRVEIFNSSMISMTLTCDNFPLNKSLSTLTAVFHFQLRPAKLTIHFVFFNTS